MAARGYWKARALPIRLPRSLTTFRLCLSFERRQEVSATGTLGQVRSFSAPEGPGTVTAGAAQRNPWESRFSVVPAAAGRRIRPLVEVTI